MIRLPDEGRRIELGESVRLFKPGISQRTGQVYEIEEGNHVLRYCVQIDIGVVGQFGHVWVKPDELEPVT